MSNIVILISFEFLMFLSVTTISFMILLFAFFLKTKWLVCVTCVLLCTCSMLSGDWRTDGDL